MTDEELKDRIADYIENNLAGRGFRVTIGRAIDDIYDLIKQAGYVRLSKDQRLPPNPSNPVRECADEDGTVRKYEERDYKIYKQAQQEMLKEGWKKVE